MSGYDWRGLLLEALSAPLSQVNVDALQWWADSEGMPSWENNWLATTIGGYGGYPVNSAGVKAYPTVQDGVDATAATLRGGAYSGVVTNLQYGNSLSDIWSAVNASPWCSRCQGGLYPVVLFNNIKAVAAGPPPPHPGPPSGVYPPPEQDQVTSAWDDVRQAGSSGTTGHLTYWQHLQQIVRGARR